MSLGDRGVADVAGHFSRYDLAAIAFLVGTLSVSTWMCAGRWSFGLVAAITLVVGLQVLFGRLYLRAFGLHRLMERSLCVSILAGTACFGLLLAVLRLLSPLGLVWDAAVLTVAAVFVYLGWNNSIRDWRVRRRTQRTELAAIALSCVAGVLWVQHSLPPMEATENEVIFHPIRDFFTHANVANVLKLDGAASVVGRPGLAGVSLPVYHYAGYGFVALPAAVTGSATYPLLMGFWTPFSVCLVGIAAFTLGRAIFGGTIGLFCCAMVVALPDPSYWTLGVGAPAFSFYSFHRVLQMAPTNAYGLAVAGLGLMLAWMGWRQRSLALAAAGLTAGMASFLFKAQIFVASFPILAVLSGTTAARAIPRRWIPRAVFLVPIGLVFGCLFLVSLRPFVQPYAPDLKIESDPGGPLTEFLATSVHRDAVLRPIAQFALDGHGLLAIGARVLFLLCVSFRWLVPIAMLALLFERGSIGRFASYTVIVFSSIVLYLCYATLLAPHRPDYLWGTAWNLQHIPFLWSHLILTIWTTGVIGRWLGRRWPRLFLASPVVLPVLLTFPLVIGQRPMDDDWLRAERWSDLSVSRGLVKCAEYVRTHSSPKDRIQDSENDSYLLMEAMAERRPYVAWTLVATFSGRDEAAYKEFQRRLKVHESLRNATTLDELHEIVGTTGIRWYLLHAETRVEWPLEAIGPPAFEAMGHRVYDFGRLGSPR